MSWHPALLLGLGGLRGGELCYILSNGVFYQYRIIKQHQRFATFENNNPQSHEN